MAVDGRKFNQSLYQGSDIEHDFPCLPCTKEGKNVAAIKHCVECDENLCQKCLGDHNKFSAMRGHQLLDTVKQPSGKKQELPRQRCEKHGGKLIDVYCPDHDNVGCSTCMTVEHRSCTDITFIPDLACKTDTIQAMKLLETEINTLESRFMTLKQKKVKELDYAKKEKSLLIKEIKSERKNINDRLDKMEMELLQEVDATFQTKLQHIESNMKEVDARIVVLQESLQKINAAKHENKSEKYVQIKRIMEKYKNTRHCLKEFEGSSKTGTLRFDPYRQRTDSECNTIGNILHLPAIELGKCTEFNVRIADDKENSDIIDMCMCEDGCIVMTDYKNKRIKKINESFKVVSSLNVADSPYGICQIGTSLLAVTLVNDRKVQFISQKDKMELQQSFEVGDRCRGIAYNDGMIYVCCGGSEKRKEGVGHIEVYSLTGKMVTSYYGEIKCPVGVAFPISTVDIFVSDAYKGIFLIDKNARHDKH
ncbi:E3 ubiquitin-protein ligase Midline-1-like [Ruditapes philippinarum]|uniref:E3 ubiquitin-protein ligase Midline-1-like n=1 Tax=Ruditapes philippinarum TaxID=129788 RepID=UPI00295B61C5|nr:E3 ubiquitin-protein ligase Midline-1-like [Ruditapes philippinarum]